MLKSALLKYWAIALVVLIGSLAAVTLFAERLPTQYTASAVVALNPRSDASGSAALFTLLTTKYVAFAASEGLRAEVAKEFGVTRADVGDGLSITMRERTTNVAIEMSSRDPRTAEGVASTVSRRIVERAQGDPFLQAQLVVPASPDSVTERSGRLRLLAVGAMASATFAVLIALFLDWRIRLRELRRREPVAPPRELV